MVDPVKTSPAPNEPQTATKARWASLAGLITPPLALIAARWFGPEIVAQYITTDTVALAIGFCAGVPTAASAFYAAWQARNKPKAA